jgi:ABC-type multidrug transport system ATPase subunit
VQRCVLARELDGDVRLLIVANPCFGLDMKAVAETRARIMAVRNAGTAVLLISEDLDEILELADRIVVMHDGQVVHEMSAEGADPQEIGRHMLWTPLARFPIKLEKVVMARRCPAGPWIRRAHTSGGAVTVIAEALRKSEAPTHIPP